MKNSEMIVKCLKPKMKLEGCEYVRDLVRCENCKKRGISFGLYRNPNACRYWFRVTKADDYCSKGEEYDN